MFVRMLKCTLKPERKEEFLQAAHSLSSEYQGQAGFVDVLTLVGDEHPDQALVLAVWKTRGEAEVFYKSSAPLLLLKPFVAEYEVEHMYMESSTVYKIATGKAA